MSRPVLLNPGVPQTYPFTMEGARMRLSAGERCDTIVEDTEGGEFELIGPASGWTKHKPGCLFGYSYKTDDYGWVDSNGHMFPLRSNGYVCSLVLRRPVLEVRRQIFVNTETGFTHLGRYAPTAPGWCQKTVRLNVRLDLPCPGDYQDFLALQRHPFSPVYPPDDAVVAPEASQGSWSKIDLTQPGLAEKIRTGEVALTARYRDGNPPRSVKVHWVNPKAQHPIGLTVEGSEELMVLKADGAPLCDLGMMIPATQFTAWFKASLDQGHVHIASGISPHERSSSGAFCVKWNKTN